MIAWARLVASAIPWVAYVTIAILYRPVVRDVARAVTTGADSFRLLLVNDSLQYETQLLPGNTGRKAK